ncbi:hydroxyacylglutathione hydrolase [Pseudoxanthomonas sp. F37]|jgi:hydroxyacylglutathione hydrolase|uniref:hydroxyacylglutathione hydrolase n=1 Tax=Pseudoxanthomonas TaxID=83618 RepID=UPI001FD56C74|nr:MULTISPECIES: hydroxyacylglutathione hydrolase [Pseudoxanthomonas]UOV05974.1 hydroxyacylglutathione hydrolase [Pseudoxanthomonas mexicana]UOV07565.1 hydroxyacylglutathione hydrolase [Pseudoxanthomonas sp. F37]
MRLLALPAFEDNYIWALVDDEGDALVIDPGDAAPVLAATGNGLWPAAVLVTHHHADHAGGIAALRARWPALPVFAPRDDRIPEASDRVGEGDVVQVKHWRLSVLEVPGHTRSHIAFHGGSPDAAPHLFCGDTLFSLGCGRLFEGTPAQMLASLDRLAALPATSLVCCGHEYTLSNAAFAATVDPHNPALRRRIEDARTMRHAGRPTLPVTLASETATNPFLRVDEDALVTAVGHRLGRAPVDRVETFATLRQWKNDFRA